MLVMEYLKSFSSPYSRKGPLHGSPSIPRRGVLREAYGQQFRGPCSTTSLPKANTLGVTRRRKVSGYSIPPSWRVLTVHPVQSGMLKVYRKTPRYANFQSLKTEPLSLKVSLPSSED